ncbi:MAG: protein kinase [Lachnospiraceae bacterium]|nr:protein kinase [Lachnospiraceae bacterium]
MKYDRCPNCMQSISGEEEKCPYCGFEIANYKEKPTCLRPFTVLQNKYMLGRVIGVGGFGITYLGWDLNLQTYIAIKEYYPESFVTRNTGGDNPQNTVIAQEAHKDDYDKGLKRYVEEAQNLSKFYTLPGIVSVKDFFYENGTAYIVMEYINGINLKEYLNNSGGRLPEATVLALMKPALESLFTVHNGGLVHRDISPDNIMVTSDGKIKLIDFGAARENTSTADKTFTVILKHGYAPPEQYYAKGNQGPWTDIYSLCAAMYKMLTGQVPPNSIERMDQDEYVSPSSHGVSVSQRTEYVLRKGLAVKTTDRYQNIGELLSDLYGTSPLSPMMPQQPMVNNVMMGGNSVSQQSMYLEEPKVAPQKKKGLGKGAIIGIISGSVAAIALAVVLIVNGNRPSKGKKTTEDLSTSTTEDGTTEDGTTEEGSTTENPFTIDNPISVPEYAFVWPESLSNDWRDYMISIDGTIYQFPMPYAEFASKGWECNSAPTSFSAGEWESLYVENNGVQMTVVVVNYSVSVGTLNQCYVIGMSIDRDYNEVRSDAEIKMAGDVTLGVSNLDQVKSKLGAPDSVYTDEEDEEGYTSVDYYGNDWDDGVDLVLRGGVLESISMLNSSVPPALQITADQLEELPPEINSQYVAPTGASVDRFDHIFTVDGVYYQLPVPFSEFAANGWILGDSTAEYIVGEGATSTYMEKDGNKIEIGLENYTRNAIRPEFGMVKYIYVESDTCSAEVIFPGGIMLGSTGAEMDALFGDLGDDVYYVDREGDYANYYNVFYYPDSSYTEGVFVGATGTKDEDILKSLSYEYMGQFK